MWPCYKYTLKNAYLRKSTLIFIGLAVLLLGMNSFTANFTNYTTTTQLFQAAASNYFIIYWFLVVSGFLVFFIGSRSTSFVADELEDGTFLTVISKPIDRKNIVLGKFLAIATANLLYIVAITFFPIMIAALKIGHPHVTSLLVSSALKTTIFSTFYMLIILSVTLPLSIKLAAKVVTLVSVAIGVVVMLGSLVLPLILGVPGITWRAQFKEGAIVTQVQKDAYETKHKTYNWVSIIDVPQHFKIMFSYATNGIAESSQMGALLSSPVKVTFEEVKVPNPQGGAQLTRYKVKSATDFANPLLLYFIYGGISLGLGAYTVTSFSKKDFM